MTTKKILIYMVLFIFSSLAIFYYWAQQPQNNSAEYNSIDPFSAPQVNFQDTIHILTYNLGYLSGMANNLAVELPESAIRENLKKVNYLISKQHIDILAFQEIDFNSNRSHHINQYQEIAQSCVFANGAMAVNWDKQYVPFPYWPIKYHFGSMYSGQAILSRLKILSNEIMILPKPESNAFYYNAFYLERLAQCVWVQNGKDSLLFINVHFEAWDKATRELQAEIVLDKYKTYEDKYPIVVLGDFNCRPPWDAGTEEMTIKILLDHPGISMVTNADEYKSNPRFSYTFNSETPYEKIDYILYNNRYLGVIKSKVLQKAGEISDHLPLFASLVIKNKQ